MNKNGFYYSLMTILLLAPIITLTVTYSLSMSDVSQSITSSLRRDSAFFFLQSVERDIHRSAEIIGQRSLTAAVNYIIDTGTGLDSADLRIKELFENGTVNGQESGIMVNSTMNEWLERMERMGENRGFLLNIELQNVNVSLKDRFLVEFDIEYTIRIEDRKEDFSFSKQKKDAVTVSIIGLEDPFYTLKTNGRVTIQFKESPFNNFTSLLATGAGNNSWVWGTSFVAASSETSTIPDKSTRILVTDDMSAVPNPEEFAGIVAQSNPVPGFTKPYLINSSAMSLIPNNTRIVLDADSGEVWSVQNLYETWLNQYYVNGNGPSFFDRLENSLTNSWPGRGLDVFVRKDILSDYGLFVKLDRSNVDHIYFNTDPVNNYRVKGMPDSFRIDNETCGSLSHVEIFGVEGLIY